MYESPAELVENEFNFKLRSNLYPVIQMGELVFREILNDYGKILLSKYFSPVLSRIRTMAIYRQFEQDMISKNFPLNCKEDRVSNFLSVPKLSNGNLFLHIAPAPNRDSLPSFSKYKWKNSFYNRFNEKQLIIDMDNIKDVRDDKYYGMITFGGAAELEFVNFIIPTPGYKEILYCKDLKSELSLVKLNESNTEVKRRKLIIREHIIENIEKDKAGGGIDN